MKKYLITAALAVAISGAFVSCSDDVSYDSLIEQKAKTFEQTFIEAYGTPAPNHTWGFKKNDVTRGSEPNSNQWFDGVTQRYKHLVQPADVTAREEEVVAEWFETNQHPTCDEIYLTEFFVQQVHFGSQVYYSTDNNGYSTSVVGGQHMDYLYAYDPVGKDSYVWVRDEPESTTNYNGHNEIVTDHKDHIYNFNTSAPQRTDTGLHNMQLMMNSSTENFGFHESYNSQSDRYYLEKDRNWVIKAIEVDGVVGYYVGFDYESHGDRGDFEPDGYFDDRIIKIVPGEGYSFEDWEEVVVRETVVEVGRVFCEDLGASSLSDIDYNDVVFDAVIIREQKSIDGTTVSDGYYAKVCLLAAGGTIPVTVGGYEVHSVLGEDEVGTQVMINTLKEEERGKVNGAAVWEHAPVVIDRIDGVSSIDAIEINALYNNKVVEVTNNGEYLAPYKLCVPIGTRWAKERVDIGGAYKKFKDYCSNPDEKFWEGEANNDSLWVESTQSPFINYNEGDVYTNTEYRKIIWRNNGSGAVDWDNNINKTLYRFGYQDSGYSNSECITTFPGTVWNQIKSGTFYLVVEGTNPYIRVTNGWWDVQWQSDFTPVNGLIDNGNGTWTLAINLSGSDLVNTIDQKHLLFTGTRFTPVKLYYIP